MGWAGGYNHFEDIYGWIITNLGYSYTFFRLIIWGSALTLLFISYKRVGINPDMTLYYFGVLFMIRFSYARVSLAMAIILLGLTFVYKPIMKLKVISYLLGLTIIGCSIFFHRSSAIGCMAAVITLFLIKNSRWKIISIALSMPLATFVVSSFLGSMLNMSFETYDASLDSKIENYLTNTVSERGIAVKIQTFLLQTPMYMSALLCAILAIKNKIEEFSMVERAFAYYVFVIMLFSFGLSFGAGYETAVLMHRTMYFAMPANAVFLMSVNTRKVYPKLFKFIYYTAFSASLYALLYSTYMGYNRM